MLQQHYYAKTKGGLISFGVGMDTVAKSRGVTNGFAADVLHRLCDYNPPYKLRHYVEENKDQYPESLIVTRAGAGELIIGKTMFIPNDVTGENSFFTHNIIVPVDELENYIANFENVLFINNFKDANDSAYIQPTLPELSTLRFDENRLELANCDHIFFEYGIDEAMFKSMLKAVLEAVASNSKVYIAPNVKVTKLFKAAQDILKYLIVSLPYSFRRNLGFVTYTKPGSEKGSVQICFLERDYTNHISPERLNGQVFDFVNNYFSKPRGEPNTTYIDYAWANRKSDRKNFYKFLDTIVDNNVMDVESLNELCMFWHIRDGSDMSVYLKNKEYALNAFLENAELCEPKSKAQLSQIFKKVVEKEEYDRKHNPSYLCDINAITLIMGIAESFDNGAVDRIVLDFSFNCLIDAANRQDFGFINGLFSSITGYARLFKLLMQMVWDGEDPAIGTIIVSYITSRVDRVSTVKELIDEIHLWCTNNVGVFNTAAIVECFVVKTRTVFMSIRNKAPIGMQFHNRMELLTNEMKDKESKKTYNKLKENILKAVDTVVIDSINMGTVTFDIVRDLEVNPEYFDNNEKFKTLQLLKEFLFSDSKYNIEKSLKELIDKGPLIYAKTLGTIKRLMESEIREENYKKITMAFRSSDEENKKNIINDLFAYICENKNRGELCNYIRWAYKNNSFTDAYVDFNNATVDFLCTFPPKEFSVVMKNFAYLYNSDKLNEGEKNLKHILDTIGNRNATMPKNAAQRAGARNIALFAMIGITVLAAVGLIVLLVLSILNR